MCSIAVYLQCKHDLTFHYVVLLLLCVVTFVDFVRLYSVI